MALKVSIIIPAHNAEDTIRETLVSVLAQTYSDWEAIVVNDGSTDRTGEIVTEYSQKESRIRLVEQRQGGEAAARNEGLFHARHEWLLFLDADDWISPSYLEQMTRELEMHPELDAVHCGSARVAADGTVTVEKYQPPDGDLFPILARRAAFPVHACVVRKSIVDAVGRFDTSLIKSPDWDLWQRIARTGAHFGAVREVLAFYRMRPNAASLDAYQLLQDDLRVLRRGHSPDDRVSNPHPDYAKGMSPENIKQQEFYLLCWCAGLLLGSGQDARYLFELVNNQERVELYPDAVAQCIFESAPLPSCLAPEQWEPLARKIMQRIDEFLAALEKQIRVENLAVKTTYILKKNILKHSPMWNLPIAQLEGELKEWQASAEEREKWRIHWQKNAEMQEKEREKWQEIADEREKWRIHWEQISKSHEKENLECQSNLANFRKQFWILIGEWLGLLKPPTIVRLQERPEAQVQLPIGRTAFAAIAILFSLFQGVFLAVNGSSVVQSIGILLALSTMFLTLRFLSSNKWSYLIVLFDLYCVQLAIFVYVLFSRGVPSSLRLWAVTLLLFHIAIVSSLLLSAAAILAKRKAILLSLTIALAILMCEMIVTALPYEADPNLTATQWAHAMKPVPKLGVAFLPGMVFKIDHNEDSSGYYDNVDPRLRKFWLRVEEKNSADLLLPAEKKDSVRVEIRRTRSGLASDVQLNMPLLAVQSGQSYTLQFRARADRPRSVYVGIARSHDPWTGLGFYKEIHVNDRWQTFDEEFVPDADETNARIHFDMGTNDASLEFDSIVLRSLVDGAVILPNLPNPRFLVEYRLNSMGCRDKEYSIPPSPGTMRVLLLGDSRTFGAGVPDENTFGSRVEQLLNEERTGKLRRYEVINCGVIGYTPREDALFYYLFAHRYAPNAVLLVFGLDIDPEIRKQNRSSGRIETVLHAWSKLRNQQTLPTRPDLAQWLVEIVRLNRKLKQNGSRLMVALLGKNQDFTQALTHEKIPSLDLERLLPDDHKPDTLHKVAASEMVRFLDKNLFNSTAVQ